MHPATTVQTPSTPPKPRRRLVVLLAFALFAVLGVFAIKAFFDWRLHVDWADAEAEADRLDPGWRLSEMLAKLEPIPDVENSALLIRDLSKGKLNEHVGAGGKYSALFYTYPPNARFSEEQIKYIEPQYLKFRDSIVAARKLKDMPRGRLPMEDADDWAPLSARNHQGSGLIVDWLKHDALFAAQDGQFELAAANCLAMLHAGRSIKDEKGFIVVLWRAAHHQAAVQTLERVLAQGAVSEKTLRSIQTALEEDARENVFLQGARGERIWRHLLFENVRDGKQPADRLMGTAPGVLGWWQKKFPATLLSSYPESLRQMNQFVELAKGPIHERAAKITAHEAATANSGNPLVGRSATTFHEIYMPGQCLLHSAVAAIACERFRLARNVWPENLDVLMKEKYLAELPLDPVDGASLRFRATPDGIVIYSIGKNGIDEQGKMHRHGFVRSDDQGFRLWVVPSRGQPPFAPWPPQKAKK